jgi:hypothetical protein
VTGKPSRQPSAISYQKKRCVAPDGGGYLIFWLKADGGTVNRKSSIANRQNQWHALADG